ncbi:MAG: hypothetical protein IKR94_07680 [Bacteroidales bacterium]|nr:hypothetical protein [Bacteroidales bacterium]
MKKILFLCAAMTAVICFTGCNKDGDDDFDDTPGSIDLRRQYCYSLTPGETNDKSLTPPVIEDDIIGADYFANTKFIYGSFFRAKAEKKGGYFVYQFFISPKDKGEWIEVGKITEDEIRNVAEAYYEGVSEINFSGETFFQKHIDLEPESYYNIKIRANYVLNGETTFAESPTNTFFTYFKDNPLVYIQKYTKNSLTFAIDNSIYDYYDSLKISISGVASKKISKDVKTITFDNLSEESYYIEYSLHADYLHQNLHYWQGIGNNLYAKPYDENENLLEYGGFIYEIKETNNFKYSIILKGNYYYTNKNLGVYIPKKGWHFITDTEKEYFKANYPSEYNQLVEKNKKLSFSEYEILVKNY